MGLPIAGAVLIGGRSSRLGRDKCLEPIAGRPLAVGVADVLRSAGCDPVVAIGAPTPERTDLGLEIVVDRWPGTGPLNGVATALTRCGGTVVVAACDLVRVRPATVVELMNAVEGVDVAVAVADGRHGALACWAPSAREVIEAAIDDGISSLWAVLEMLRRRDIDVRPEELIDIDTEDDLIHHRRSVGC